MDTKCQRVIKEIPVLKPTSLVFDGGKLYVASRDFDIISVITTESDISKTFDKKIFTLPRNSKPAYLAVADQQIFVASLGSENLNVIDIPTNKSLTPLQIGQIQSSVAFDPVNKRLYVLDVNNNTLSVVTENVDNQKYLCRQGSI